MKYIIPLTIAALAPFTAQLAHPSFAVDLQVVGAIQGFRAFGSTPDGSTIVGFGFAGGGSSAMKWTQATGVQLLGATVPVKESAVPLAISADGSMIVGYYQDAALKATAIVWDAAGNFAPLPGLQEASITYSNASFISADGTVIAGNARINGIPQAFRYTVANGIQPTGTMPAIVPVVSITSMSADGSTLAGNGFSLLGNQGFLWTHAGGFEPIPLLPGSGNAQSVFLNADASVAFGGATMGPDATIQPLFRYTAANGTENLGSLMPSPNALGVAGLSADGKRVLGNDMPRTNNPQNLRTPFLWTEEFGFTPIADLLAYNGVATNDAVLQFARGMSADGNTIFGDALLPPTGLRGTWIVNLENAAFPIPEPATLALLALNLPLLLLRRRSSRQ